MCVSDEGRICCAAMPGVRHNAGEAIGQRSSVLLCKGAAHLSSQSIAKTDLARQRAPGWHSRSKRTNTTRSAHGMVVAAAFAGLVSDLSRLGLSTATADALALHAQQGGMPLDGARARASQALFSQSVSQPLPRS